MTEEQKNPGGDRPLRAAVLKYSILALIGVATGGVAVWLGIQPTVQIIVTEKVVYRDAAGAGDGGYTPTFGWFRDDAVIEANLDPARTPQFGETPAGRAALDAGGDVFLWRAVRKAAGRAPPWFFNVDQKNVGCCVGCAYAHGVDTVQATQILDGRKEEWKPVSVEAIYGFSRVEVGGGRISGDGSVGAWAARAVAEYGVLEMTKYPSADLTEFSPARAREFGRRGVPDDLEPTAKKHLVKNTALVKSWAEVRKAVRQGYPVAVCSDQGFRMERDATGRARPQGVWNHAMCVIGVRGGDNEGAFVLNSWGDRAHTGPVWPDDAPVAGFWADAAVIDRMVRQGDSFALSDMTGFPARPRLPFDWFIRARPAGGARFAPRELLASAN